LALHFTQLYGLNSEVSAQHKKALRKVMLYFSNVDEVDPRRIQWSGIRYHRNNNTYKMLLNICYLVIEGMLMTEQDGSRKMARYVDDQRMHRLYEKFVLEYYRRHYPQFNATAAHIDWDVDGGGNRIFTYYEIRYNSSISEQNPHCRHKILWAHHADK